VLTDSGRLVERRRPLEPRPESARVAREMVHEALREASRQDLGDVAELLVSELVTNAIVHARTPIEVAIVAGPDGVRVSVHDDSPYRPTPRHYGTSATTGRGLELLSLMSDRHGTDIDAVGDPGSVGKTVWFEFGAGRHADEEQATVTVEVPDTGQTLHLIGLPVVLGRAWQQHADALLRELLLSRWDDDGPLGGVLPEDDAAAGDAFSAVAAALEELGPIAGLPSHIELVLPLGRDASAQFVALDVLLEHVSDLAERGHTLAPPTQPEIRMLRRWICAQATEQAAGRAPTPWPGVSPDVPAPERPPVAWDHRSVHDSVDAVIAGDDANRIVAASPAALELLGWDDDLVGLRLVSIIPARLREAHIASFTMQLLTGETSILDREITVPALRRDGTEIEVLLLVRRENLPDGRALFTARMRRVVTALMRQS